MRTQRIVFGSLIVVAAVWALGSTAAMTSPHFYADDPIAREPESQDASRAARADMGDLYEMVINLFDHPRYTPSGLRAQDVNTVDEVPDSNWFTNRIRSEEHTSELQSLRHHVFSLLIETINTIKK